MVNLNRNGSVWDRNERIRQNANWETIEQGLERVESVVSESQSILDEARQVNSQNTDTNERLDNIIADSGTSSTEVVDARGNFTVLGERLNEQQDNIDYLRSRPMLNNGKIILPSDFPEIPFNIYREDKYKYSHDATPYNQFDWSNATEIFIIDKYVASRDGLSYENAITPENFRQNQADGMYGAQDTFIFTMLDNAYTRGANITIGDGVKNLLVRSASPQGKTIVSRLKRLGGLLDEWVRYNDIYKITIDNPDHPIDDIINTRQSEWEHGLPSYYKKVETIQEVENEKGTYAQINAEVYCNPHKTESIFYLLPSTIQNLTRINPNHSTVIFENIIFLNKSNEFPVGDVDINIYWFNCGFLRGNGTDAFNISGGKYSAYLLDCVSAYGQKDGFNYHTSNAESLAVEVNCISHGNGMYKRTSGNQTTHSNNGSTAHDGMNMLRVGSHYWDNEGPVVADVNDCYSISIGCKVGDILGSTTGSKTAFLKTGNSGTSVKPKYVLECMAYGENIDYGIFGHEMTYYMDFEGHEKLINAEKIESWGR